MFDTLDSIPWKKVSHAYGPATDVPKWIRALSSDDPEERVEAVNYFLWSSVFHQRTLYSATPLVIPFVIEALGSTQLAERDDGMGMPMKVALIHFLRLCAEAGNRAIDGKPLRDSPSIESAILTGRLIYERSAKDGLSEVETDARWLLQFCDAHSKAAGHDNPEEP